MDTLKRVLKMPLDLTGCRICLKPEKIMFPLFQKSGLQSAILYSDMLNYCVDLQVRLRDDLPNKMCLSCKRNLEIAYSFKKLAKDSNTTLLKKLSTVNVKAKVHFNNPEDLKNKIDSKAFVEIIPKNETLSILDTEKEITICNTSIRKIKPDIITKSPNNACDVKMEEEYLDEEYLVSDADDVDYEPPKKLQLKRQKSKNNLKIQNNTPIIAQIKENIKVIRIDKYEKKFPKKNAIPIKERQMNYLSRPGDVDDQYKKYLNAQVKKQTYHQRKPRTLITKLNKNKPEKTNCLIKVKLGTGDWDTDETKDFKIVKEKPRPKEKHICPVCGLLTFTLAKHILTHDETKPFSCSECPKSFTSKIYFDMHMKKHSGVKDQICEICGAAFFFTRSVIRHMLIHKGERPYSCHLCPKKFIANCDLTRHLKVHAGYKPYKCDTCTMSFNAKHQLINHVRIHTGEKPYVCEVCNVTFSYKVNLNNHVFKMHRVNLRYKSIYRVTPEVLSQEYQLAGNEAGKSLPLIVYPDNG